MMSRSLPSASGTYCLWMRRRPPSSRCVDVRERGRPAAAASSSDLPKSTISSPLNGVSLRRSDMRVERESTQTLVNRPDSGSKPMIPRPVVLPDGPSNVKSDCRNRPSLIIAWWARPLDFTGSPDFG